MLSEEALMTRRMLAAMMMVMSTTMTAPASAQELNQAIRQDMPELMALYRDLHHNPELSLQETRSPGLLATGESLVPARS